MTPAPTPAQEVERIAVLRSLQVLDTPRDPVFDSAAALARSIAGTPIALISLIDAERQWFKACIGLDVAQTPRDIAFCAHAILGDEVLWVEDAAKDPRFAANPLVTGPPHISFYAGAPLIVRGHAIGTLCVISPDPRPFEPVLAERLTILAGLVASRLAERRRHELFACVVEHTPDAVACCDNDGLISYWNPAAERLFGRQAGDVLGQHWAMIIPKRLRAGVEEAFNRARHDATASVGGGFMPLKAVRADGSEFAIELALTRSADPASADLAVIARDCTEREQARAALECAKNAAEASSRAKSAFLANMGHELRTPMNGILGMLQLLGRRELDAASRDYVTTAEASAGALHRTLEKVLVYARLETGKAPLEVETFEAGRLIEDAVAMASAVGIHVRGTTAPGTPACLVGDLGKLRQILVQLTENAVRFGGDEVAIEIAVTPASAGSELVMSVQDNGPGVPPEARARIFESFNQADNSNTRVHQGAGLGLALCRALTRAMDGEITLEGDHDKGARFVVRLPVLSVAPDSPQAASDVPVGPTSLRILVVEDHPVNEQVLLALLDMFGQRADVARNGAEAVAAAERRDYDLILMDIQMPVMDGLTATRTIRGNGRNGAQVPIFALTASASPADLKRYHEAGMNGLAPKPVQPDRLIAILEEATDWPGLDDARPQDVDRVG